MQPRDELDVALATAEHLPELDEDSRPLLAELRRRGVRAEPIVWGRPVRWDRVGLCVVRSTWGYDAEVKRFRAWAKATQAETALVPSAALLSWNTDKAYLRALEAAGTPVVPTLWLRADGPAPEARPARRSGTGKVRRARDRGASAAAAAGVPGRETSDGVPVRSLVSDELDALPARLAERRWKGDVVAKPAVAGGARGLERFAAAEAGAPEVRAHLTQLLTAGPVLLQPFLDSVQTDGERSLLFADGRLTHAVLKRPAAGDFRVQPQWGGTAALVEPTSAELTVAEQAFAAAPEPPVIARVDLLAHPELGPVVIELELVEPRLFLRAAPADAAAAYADAILARLPRA